MSKDRQPIIIVQEAYALPRLNRVEKELAIFGSGMKMQGGISIEHVRRGTDLSRVQLVSSRIIGGQYVILGEIALTETSMDIYGFENTKGMTRRLLSNPIAQVRHEDTLPQDAYGKHRGIRIVHYTETMQETGYSYLYALASSFPETRQRLLPKELLKRRRYALE